MKMQKRALRAIVLSLLGAAAPWAIAGPQNIDPGGVGPDRPAPFLLLDRGDCGSDSLTQSTNPNVIGAATIICGTAEVSAEFSLARVFTAPYTMSVECVTFGVRLNDGPEWPARVRILSGPVNAPYDSLTLLAESVLIVPADSSFEFHTVAMPDHVIAAGSEFIVELRSDSRLPADGGDDGLLGFGCNVQGQSAPTYYRGPACAQPTFIDLANLGFGGRHLVMTLGVEAVMPPGNDSPLEAPAFDLGRIASFTTVGAASDGPPNSCANESDVWFTVQAGVENTMTVALLAQDGADMALALYDLGPSGVFDVQDLASFLVGCVDAPTPGEEVGVFDVTPGHFYLVQVGSGANAVLPGTGTGVVGFWDGSQFEPFQLPVLACIPCVGCIDISFTEYQALSSLGVTQVFDCINCDQPPSPTCPCLDDVAHMIAYWPMDVTFPAGPQPVALDAIGSADIELPCSSAAPGCNPEFATIAGVSGAAVAMNANAFGGASTRASLHPFPDVGKGPFTVAAWVRRNATGTTEVFNASGFATGWSVTIAVDGRIQLDITSDNCPSTGVVSLTAYSSGSTVTAGVWTHIAVAVSKQSTGAGCLSGGDADFYINGEAEGRASLTGLYYDCSAIKYSVGGPNVWIDEVMLFDRFLTAARIEEIYATAAIGPCDFSIRQTPIVDCISPTQTELVICNVFGQDQNFTFSFAPLPDQTPPVCEIAPGGVTSTTASPIFVPSGSCVSIPVSVTLPGCVSNTQSASWIATVTNSGSPPQLPPESKVALSTVLCQYVTFGGGGGGILGLSEDLEATQLLLDLSNVFGAPLTASYKIGITNPDGDPDSSMFSLNGLPPGEAVFGILNLAAGGVAQVPITLEALSVDVLGWYELTLSIDITGGSNFEPSDSIGLQALAPLPVIPCPGDTNGDNVIDFADLNTLLSSFNTAPPNPGYNPGADFDNDGDVDFSDLNVLLSAFNTIC